MSNNRHYVYIIFNRLTSEVVYVGCTKNMGRRSLQYYKKPDINDTPIVFYVFNNFNSVDIRVIDHIDTLWTREAHRLERFWIEQFRQWGFPLLNIKFNLNFKRHLFRMPADHPLMVQRFSKRCKPKNGSKLIHSKQPKKLLSK